ncbi:MAG: hypothetical protein COB98_03160 [Flavobacteriaceae bacterium]|nr:MAG: hypothetical protein COB98_03160 [Flavobacteriaceae bacterium]
MTPLLAQVSPNVITVQGEAIHKVEVKEYNAIIILTEIKVDSYQNLEAKTLGDVSLKFEKKLKKIGIDFKKFKPNISYELYNISVKKKTVVYNYKTTSITKIRALVKVSMNGLNVPSVTVEAKKLSLEEIVHLSNEAIGNAQILASGIAKMQHRKIGKIIQIVNSQLSDQTVNSYDPGKPQLYAVTVSFELL